MNSSRHQLTFGRRLGTCAAATAFVVTGVGCSDDSGSEAKPVSPSTTVVAGSDFSGTYSVQGVNRLIDGKPPAEQPETFSLTWIVQSKCPGNNANECVAVAQSSTPDNKTNLNRDHMEFVFTDGAWLRSVTAADVGCTLNTTGKPADEKWAAIHTTRLTPDDPAAGPVAKLSGTIDVLRGGTCQRKLQSDITLTRTGDVPAGTAPLTVTDTAAAVTDSPALQWHGRYEETRVVASGPGQPIGKRSTLEIRVTTQCTRDGSLCLATVDRGDAGYGVFAYRDGTFERKYSAERQNCPVAGTVDSIITIEVTPDAGSPTPSLHGLSTTDYQGDCPGMTTADLTYKRIGD
ncbi:hypothetical protein [Antrihabitans stalactiti]|uniref:Uncharacterized protein n=1 Tax=Antrihabitans stalactiti TaxID=2584121 RepID=A0A848KAA6_9NOCA|nr:hypothetical protein [Antrihabitans stalactiti]NMN94398.1 hypothetical protein [Antrihabitans stalactiti]